MSATDGMPSAAESLLERCRQEALATWAPHGKWDDLVALKPGFSGAALFRIKLLQAGLAAQVVPGQYVLKLFICDESERHGEKEVFDAVRNRVNNIKVNFFKKHVPELKVVHYCREGAQKCTAMLMGVAGNFDQYAPAGKPSDMVLQAKATSLAKTILDSWSHREPEARQYDPHELLNQWLEYRLDPDSRLAVLATEVSCNTKGISCGTDRLVNPFWFYDFLKSHASDCQKLQVVTGNLHMDFHGDNILLLQEAIRKTPFYVIDFSLSRVAPVGFDHAYLEVFLCLKNLEQKKDLAPVALMEVLKGLDITKIIVLKHEESHIHNTITKLRNGWGRWKKQAHMQHMDADLERQNLLSRVAAGLNWANKPLDNDENRKLALYYAGYYATQYLKLKEPELFNQWISASDGTGVASGGVRPVETTWIPESLDSAPSSDNPEQFFSTHAETCHDARVLVQIRVVHTGRVAMGLVVEKERILTCRDLLSPGINCPEKIQVRWCDDGEWFSIRKVVWQGEGDLDVALIDCSFPKTHGQRYARKFADDIPILGARWSGCAFPDRLDSAALLEPCSLFPISGAALELKGQTVMSRLDPFGLQDFRGGVGSPVYNADGVVVGVLGVSSGQVRAMVPVAHLFKIPGFMVACYWQEELRRQKRLEDVKQQLRVCLHHKAVSTYLNDQLNKVGFRNGAFLEERLLGLELIDLIQLLVNLYNNHKLIMPDVSKVASQILCLMVPIRLPHQDLHDVRAQMADPEKVLIALNTASKTVAEFIMAGVMEREASFRQSAGDTHASGRTAVPLGPESGRVDIVDVFFSSIEDQMIEEILDNNIRNIVDKMTGLDKEGKRHEMLNRVRARLNQPRGMFESSVKNIWYFIISEEINSKDEVMMRRFSAFRESYQNMFFITLSTTVNRLQDDDEKFHVTIPVDMLTACR
ncbi:MAG: hypothetical protein G8237_04120 [Magnetococcales bacterium]|nr:hypothetical protein [Magnetococcales bacterium]NGZ05520.1 hypothetical protein [Magnetococcales bacterium]